MKKTILAALLTLATSFPAHAVFKCVDEKGVTHYGDTMPPQCEKKPVTELSTEGSVVRKIAPPPTAEQLAAREAEKVRNAELEKKIAAQQMQDRALLAIYGSEREIDALRDRDLKQIDAREASLKARTAEIDKRLVKLNNDMEFYQAGKGKSANNKQPPEQLVQSLAQANKDKAGIAAEIQKLSQDRGAIKARYEKEKTRWKRLKEGMPAGTLTDDKGDAPSPPVTSPSK
ncbi:MAG: DUF4124 domain-containing protein [Betaproteobacteria bacterium]|nr:DUF4124 domain-containing protein [Betaproteobacteria bacterium]